MSLLRLFWRFSDPPFVASDFVCVIFDVCRFQCLLLPTFVISYVCRSDVCRSDNCPCILSTPHAWRWPSPPLTTSEESDSSYQLCKLSLTRQIHWKTWVWLNICLDFENFCFSFSDEYTRVYDTSYAIAMVSESLSLILTHQMHCKRESDFHWNVDSDWTLSSSIFFFFAESYTFITCKLTCGIELGIPSESVIFVNSLHMWNMILLRQIPFPDLREFAHLSGREVKTLFL